MANFKYLDEEREKLWDRVVNVEKEVSKISEENSQLNAQLTTLRKELDETTPEVLKEARQNSKKTSEFRNKTEKTLFEANDFLEQIKGVLNDIKRENESLKKISLSSNRLNQNIQTKNQLIQDALSKLEERKNKIDSDVQELEEHYEDLPNIKSRVESLQDIYEEVKDNQSKISTILKNTQLRRNEISDLHREIFGYVDEEGEEKTIIQGYKDELDNAYGELKENVKILEREVSDIEDRAQNSFESKISEWNRNYISLDKKIKELLPNALTAGLSSAYSEKKSEEIIDSKKYQRTFYFAIAALILISVLPFLVGIKFLLDGREILDVIYDLPRMSVSILPLYVPALWVAYSSNKKLNLSKRLIEEYTHKEVLSKTFEGLSRQIDEIGDNDISSELRLKLLSNVLDISSENPGKLISDYNKSDHPLMEALDKSAQLSRSIERISSIPGMAGLIKVLEKKQKKVLEESSKGISEVLETETEKLEDKS